MKKYVVTSATRKKHKKFMTFLWVITYILFFPFVILAYINEFIEKVLDKISILRNKIVYGIVKLLFKKDCKIVESENR